MPTPLLSVVIPCYNEEGSLPALYERLAATLAPYRAQELEILLVDDGSSDNTWAMIESLSARDVVVKGLRLSRNFGHQMALACGLDHAQGQRVLMIDADLQDPPELIADMMKKMDEGFDAVHSRRAQRQGETGFKRWSAWVYYRLLNRLSDVAIPVDSGDFRLMSRKLVDLLKAMPERVRFTRGLVSWLGFKQAVIEYVREGRYAGRTHYSLRDMLRFASDGITSFSTRPLRFAIWLGVAMMAISMLLLIYVFISWVFFATVRGWTSLAAIVLLSQSVQWLILGIMGNYIAVMFREIKARPLYIVESSTKTTKGA